MRCEKEVREGERDAWETWETWETWERHGRGRELSFVGDSEDGSLQYGGVTGDVDLSMGYMQTWEEWKVVVGEVWCIGH